MRLSARLLVEQGRYFRVDKVDLRAFPAKRGGVDRMELLRNDALQAAGRPVADTETPRRPLFFVEGYWYESFFCLALCVNARFAEEVNPTPSA